MPLDVGWTFLMSVFCLLQEAVKQLVDAQIYCFYIKALNVWVPLFTIPFVRLTCQSFFCLHDTVNKFRMLFPCGVPLG